MQFRIYETPDDLKHLPAYDYTKLSDINTCPTWGILRRGMNKNMPGAGRQHALEAGQVCHEVFASIRLFQLMYKQHYPDHAMYAGQNMFGKDRWRELLSVVKPGNTDETNSINFVLETLHTANWIDDPNEKRKTMSAMEATCIEYLNRWDWDRWPIWMEDVERPNTRVGVEVPIDLIVEADEGLQDRIRYTGRMDGLHYNGNTPSLLVHENKTSGRLDLAWRMSFIMSHQVTGYINAAQCITGKEVKRAHVIGAQLPMPGKRALSLDGIATEDCTRERFHTIRWINWMQHSIAMYEQWAGNPYDAPKYTISCSRYFRPCPFIPFCYGDRDEMQTTIEQMVHDEWNPLHNPHKYGE